MSSDEIRLYKQYIKATTLIGKSVNYQYTSILSYAIEHKLKFCGIKENYLLDTTYLYLKKFGYIKHTIDKKSFNNRAVDLDLINPLTANYMSGSSSGSAYNILNDINDIAIGTDGGGSVIYPALNCNLYSFISQKLPIEKEYKYSTDDIKFKVCAGLISKNLTELLKIYEDLNTQCDNYCEVVIFTTCSEFENSSKYKVITYEKNLSRSELIKLVEPFLKKGIVISYEEDIDVYGLGDSIIGGNSQIRSNKGIGKVVNILKADCFTVPVTKYSSGYIICAREHSDKLIKVVKEFEKFNNELINRYFNV